MNVQDARRMHNFALDSEEKTKLNKIHADIAIISQRKVQLH